MNEIRERITRLVGEGPYTNSITFTPCSVTNGIGQAYGGGGVGITSLVSTDSLWQNWRSSLIDRLCANAKVLTGFESPHGWIFDELKPANHRRSSSALILDIQPIRKGVTKDEILRTLQETLKAGSIVNLSNLMKLQDRIISEGIIP